MKITGQRKLRVFPFVRSKPILRGGGIWPLPKLRIFNLQESIRIHGSINATVTLMLPQDKCEVVWKLDKQFVKI